MVIACCLAALVAPAPAASQDLEVLAAAAGELRDVIDGIRRLNDGVEVARAIHRGREGAVWSGAALDTLRSRLETVPPESISSIGVCRGDGRCLPPGPAVTLNISAPVWTGDVATIFARVVIRSATFPLHPTGEAVLVTLRLSRAALPGGWQIERLEEPERSRISRAARVRDSRGWYTRRTS